MKKIVLLAMAAVLSLSAMAQKNYSMAGMAQKKVAVYITGTQNGVTKILGDQLVSAFSKSSEYTAIERTNSFLAELSKEQSYQRSGAVDDKEISRLGKQFGVQYVCVADIQEAFGKKYVSARLINVENAEVISTANEYSNLDSMEELMRVSNVLKGQLLGSQSMNSSIPAGFVDLGLPSGTLWSKKSFGQMNYANALQICKDKNTQIPDVNQWTELQTECVWTKKTNGFEVRGVNGNTIILLYKENKYGNYWTSTCRYMNNKGECTAVFYFYIDGTNYVGTDGLKNSISDGGGYTDTPSITYGLVPVISK